MSLLAVKEKAAAAAKAQDAKQGSDQVAQKEADVKEAERTPGEAGTVKTSSGHADGQKDGTEGGEERLILHTVDKTEHEKQVRLLTCGLHVTRDVSACSWPCLYSAL